MTPKDFLQEICPEQNIKFETFSGGYIVRLTKGETVRHMYGSHLDANPAAADRIACDKCACYAILTQNRIPAVPHILLQHPVRRIGFIGGKGTWIQTLEYFKNADQKAVVKPNHGTNGHNVYLCDSVQTLETAVHEIFQTEPTAAISPFFNIKTEYRVFYVYGECPLVYAKQPSSDNWRHNLSQGATAVEVEDKKKLAVLKELASQAARAININFATVDIIEIDNSELMIMEINAGVQARQLLEQRPHLYPVIKEIYARAVTNIFT